MCTVSVIKLDTEHGPGLRLISNRDELDSRPPAAPPAWRDHAIYPTDTLANGTWVAGTQSGVLMSLLNYNLEPPPELPDGLASRGALIPALADADDLAEIERRLRAIDMARYAPFRLVVASSDGAIEFRWDRQGAELLHHDAPACWASSGLGDSIVQRRLPLFDAMVRQDPTAGAQDAFHRHRFTDGRLDDGAASVLMRRPGARTISITTAEAIPHPNGGWRIEMDHDSID